MIDSSKASDFHWDHEVCEFFETIKYLGGQRTRNFVRGPGFHGTGRGGKKQFTTFTDFNLCGPSTNASNHCKAGYTTDSGIIKPHLQSFHAFSDHPKADINYLVKSDDVQVIGVSLAMDGTALKPGLEFDIRQERIIGLTFKVDLNYVCHHPVPDPQEIKKNLITSAEVTFMTSVDNSSTMPVGVHYHPKSVSGEKMLSQMLGVAKTVQDCERCLTKQSLQNHIVTHENTHCNSKCDTSSNSSLFTAHCYANEVSRHTNPSNFGMMKVNSGHHSGHPNCNIRYYDSEGNDDDIGEGGEPILGELSYPNKSSAVLRVKSVECSA